jgi:hypothetical protein
VLQVAVRETAPLEIADEIEQCGARSRRLKRFVLKP